MNHDDELRQPRRLRRAVERLPRELQPRRNLWPEIAGRLERRPQRRFAGGWWRLAAAMLLTAGGLLVATLLRPEASPVGTVLTGPTGPAMVAGPPLAAPHLRQRDGVLHAHNDLVTIVAWQRGRLDEAGAAAVAAGLAELERATADIEAALVANPRDRRLRLALAAAYRRESGWTSRLGRV